MFATELVELPQSAATLFPEQADDAALHTRPESASVVQLDEPH